jgi:signal-transduction protein with cAMP-binding, CBS, and nucleotidyltransferase domain
VAALAGDDRREGVGARIGRAQPNGRESRVPGHDVRIADVTIRSAPVIPLGLNLGAARKVARLKSSAVVLVEEAGALVGLLDERVLATADDDEPIARRLRPILFSLQPTATAARARELFVKQNVSALPVAAGAFLLGVVSRADVERALAQADSRSQPGGRRAAA